MRVWINFGLVLGLGLAVVACSPVEDECKDHPRCSNFASSGSSDAADSAEDVQRSLLEDVKRGNLSAEELTAALNYGHIEVTHIEQGYSSEQLLGLVRQQLRPAYASTPDECRVVGIGSRPCGGPERFMIYSTANTNEAVLFKLVGAYNRKRAADNRREGMVSDCRVLPEPVAVLRDGMCRVAETATH